MKKENIQLINMYFNYSELIDGTLDSIDIEFKYYDSEIKTNIKVYAEPLTINDIKEEIIKKFS